MESKKVSYILDEENHVELIVYRQASVSYPMHNHISVFTIGMIMDGMIAMTVNQDIYLYGAGDTFVIPPYFPHSIKPVSPYTMLCLCVSVQALKNADFVLLEAVVRKLLKNIAETEEKGRDKVVRLLRGLAAQKEQLTVPKLLLANELREQLELYPEKKISIDEMADTVFISKYHFIRHFKQEVGLTPHQFQLQNRIRKAQKLLYETESIAEVAMNTGFCDQSHFIKQFEKIVDLSPSSYQDSCKQAKADADA